MLSSRSDKGTVEAKRSPVTEALQAMEQKCTSFLEALKACSKESSRIGSGMKSKYSELTHNVTSFSKTLQKGSDAKLLLNFPTKLSCCTLLEGITFANNKTKSLVAHNTAIQQLFGIIEFLYQRSSLNAAREEPIRIGLDNNDLYIYIDMIFKMFETIAKLHKVDESVHLRTVQTLLLTFSTSSPVMIYEDILRRGFQYLDTMLKGDSNVLRPIVEGGVRQLVQCLLSNSRKRKGGLSRSGTMLAELGGHGVVSTISPFGMNAGAAAGLTVFSATPQIAHVDLTVDLITCLCTVIKGESSEFMVNLGPTSAAELLLIAVTAMPKGSLFELPKLQTVAKSEVYTALKYALAGATLLNEGCAILAKVMEHGYYYSNHCPEPDRGAAKLFTMLYNFVELDLIETSTPEGIRRRIAWIRGLSSVMQSNDMLDDMFVHKTSRKHLVEMLNFIVKHLRMNKETNLDQYFEGIYKCGEGQQLISEQIDSLEQEGAQHRPVGMKMLPIFAAKLEPGSCAMDFCNMTNGVVGKTSRIVVSDDMDMQQLEMVESALAVDAVLAAAHVLYSCVVGANSHKTSFAAYRIFYPKVAGDYPPAHRRMGSSDSVGSSESVSSANDEAILDGRCRYLNEAGDIVVQQLERMLNTMRSPVMQEVLIAAMQATLVVCNVYGWEDLYTRCVNALVAYFVLVERQFVTDHRKCAMETWSLYLLHIRCLNAMMLNYPSALQDLAWESFLEHLLSFILISRRLGVANRSHLRSLEPLETDAIMPTFKGLHEEWEATLTETIGAFDRLKVHDFEVLKGFVTQFGFHVAIPLLAKSQYTEIFANQTGSRSGVSSKEKLALIERTLDAWPDQFLRMIENGDQVWPELLRELTHSLDRESVLAGAEPEFLHCLFTIITELSFARQHDSVMLLTGIVMCLTRDRGGIELMIQTICGNIVSLCLAGQQSSARSIDAGVCVLYKTLRDNSALSMDIMNGLKTVCTTVPQIMALSSGIVNCLMYATKLASQSNDSNATIVLIDVFSALVDDSAELLQDDACLPFVESIFMLSQGAYNSDNNAAFRVVALVLDFAEKMAAQSHYFGAARPPRAKEEDMWKSIFKGLKDLGHSEFTEIRQCAIKSLALFIKGRLNRFEMELWQLCCREMLKPLAEGLVCSIHTPAAHQTVFTACEELYVAFKDCEPRYRENCEAVIAILVTGLETVVNATIGNKMMLPNELNSALGLAIGIATNIVIDYCRNDFIWNKCMNIMRAMMHKDVDLLRQNFFKSICSILTALSEQEEGIEEKLMQVIRMALGDPTKEEAQELEALATATSEGAELSPWLVVPPWILSGSVLTGSSTQQMAVDYLCEEVLGETVQAVPAAPLTLYETLKLADDPKIKFTLRDKIQNSVGILQEMQMLQLVTLHYTPQILGGTEALAKVTPEDVLQALDNVPAEASEQNQSSHSSLSAILTSQERAAVMTNIVAHVKEPPLITLVETYNPVSKLFRSLGSIKSPAVYGMLVESLVNKYLMGDVSKVALALQLIDKIVLSVRDMLIRFVTESSEAIANEDRRAIEEFLASKTYRILMCTVLPMAPLILEIAKTILVKHTLQPVALILYQACINISKYIYLALYVTMHFMQVNTVASQPVVDFWRAVIPAMHFFTTLNYNDELETRIKYIRLLHAVEVEVITAMVVNPFSVAPPFVYSSVAGVLNRFADTSLNVPPPHPAAVRMRVVLTKHFFFVLASNMHQFLGNKDCEIEVLAALKVVESISTLPNELIFDNEYLRKHKYLRYVQKRPLASLTMPALLELLESENKRVIRATRRILSLFLEEMGAQVTTQ
ncbi:hypothetical protein, conserved [Babesia ovata]|uniref:Uncharacterized protein n=1 Tax=Babesia ovata TaxID=189622 RepID=A0A2H6KBU8_9APIC|nr:uncharacterized protein BOVATA_019660 [Babesia ovata]GBE60473.1 hypothetical protein, conserved [Babesia ovata]